jgi:oligopeptide/dipeptide ABC transporter ATP-binding protein
MPVLEIEDLEVRYRAGAREARAVAGISLALEAGECLGLIGESGCGKSTIAKAVMGLLPPGAFVAGGSIRLDGRELLGLPEQDMRRIRWRSLALVPQAAMNGFDPVYTIEAQLRETVQAHERVSSKDIRRRAEQLFLMVGLPTSRLTAYPHQFSGGMRQRAMIAMSLILDPKVIVADEPTTGLDVIVQDQILQNMIENSVKAGKSMLLITHDMGVVAENCDKIAVMYAGHIVEYGDQTLFQSAYHPYTLGLINAFPNLADRRRKLISIPGSPPDLFSPPTGCCFRQRCPFATDRCLAPPPLLEVSPGRRVACHYPELAQRFRKRAAEPATWDASAMA